MKRNMAVLIMCCAMLISITYVEFDALAAAGDISASGNLKLPATTPTAGIIYSGPLRLIHTYGIGNFFAGEDAGNLTMTGTGNTASGYRALYSNTTGIDNTASGTQALYSNTTGGFNTASGSSALYLNTTGIYNTASGYRALYSNTTGHHNTASSNGALSSNTTGIYNTAVGVWAGDTITTGGYNTFVGAASDASANNLTNATAIGYGAIVNESYMVRIGNAAVTVIQGQVGFSSVSDFRHKKDIEEIRQGLDFVKALRPVQYRLKSGNERIDFGFIAQEIEALIGTDHNVLGIGADADRALSLRYADFIAPMVKAIQEQQGLIESQQGAIESQQGAIESQRGEINELTARLARLEALLINR